MSKMDVYKSSYPVYCWAEGFIYLQKRKVYYSTQLVMKFRIRELAFYENSLIRYEIDVRCPY